MRKKTISIKKWEELTPEDRQYFRDIGVLNGFGGSGQSFSSRWLIGLIVKDFNVASADKHDWGYYIGGTEERRKECDEKFYQAMLLDIYDMYMEGRITKSEQIGKSIIALLAWCAIRLFGWKYFEYDE